MRHLILGSLILAATAASQARAEVAVDLSQYACAGLDTAAARAANQIDARHIAQIIDGTQTDWTAFFVTDAGTRRLKCITTTTPDARALSRDEASAFLAKVTGTGAAAKAATALKAPLAASATNAIPAEIRAEPLKAKPTSVGTVSKTAPLPAAKDITGASAPPASRSLAMAALSVPQAAPLTAATVSSSARTRIATPPVQPWRSIGQLDATFPNGETVRYTATLISEYAVLTAGACIHNAARGGYATAAAFHPGQYDAVAGDGKPVRPYGSKTDVASFRTTQRWTEISGNANLDVTDHAYNIGAVLFKTPYRPPVSTDWGGPAVGGGNSGTVVMTFAGYPSSIDGKTAYSPYSGEGWETEDSRLKYSGITHTTENKVAVTAGDVGAPILSIDDMLHQGVIYGLVTYGDAGGTVGGGPMIEYGWNRDLVLGWQAWKPAGLPLPTEAASDLRVANIFSTSQPTSQSYLRFHNAESGAGTVTVELADPTSGAKVGSWTSPSIAGGSELQVFIQDIERGVTTTGAKPANFAMSVRPTFEGYFQHVLWQRAENTLTNLTSCDTGVMNEAKTLTAVHSSLIAAGYPSTVVVYNSGDTVADISLGIFDARNGQRLGTYAVGKVQPNAQATATVLDIERIARLTPTAGMYHYVIKADTAFTGYLQHIVHNTGDGVLTDMSIMCRLSPGG